ncbi:phage portal protein [Streptosporangium canum]|uniref:phage portal protein n=1 Tax=Streptosporangium canum TaxID=324952 RepID=UPI00378E13F0
MGLLEKVAEARAGGRAAGGRKSWSEANFWDLERLRWPFLGSSSLNSEREEIENDFEGYVQGIAKANGPVFALMTTRMLVFSEARFQFRRMSNGRPGDLFGTPDLALLERPWTNATTGDLLARMIQDVDLAGNAFVAKINGRLRRLRPDWVTVVSGSKTERELYGNALDGEVIGYFYDPPNSGKSWFLLPREMAHFAPIPDPQANWRGMSWLTPVLREISSDLAATRHKGKFFENGATPQVIVSLDASVTPEMFQRFKATMNEAHQGVDNAYKTLYLGGGADVTIAGKDLQQLDFKATQGAGETRIAAAAGVPAVIVGFSEGLAGSSLNAGNFGQARRRFADGTLRPLWRNAAGSLASLVTVPDGAELWYDDRDIAFLREDKRDSAEIQQVKAASIRQLVDAGYEPVSVVAAIEAEDLTLLKHSGLYSVQLQPPGTGSAPPPADPPGPDPAKEQ